MLYKNKVLRSVLLPLALLFNSAGASQPGKFALQDNMKISHDNFFNGLIDPQLPQEAQVVAHQIRSKINLEKPSFLRSAAMTAAFVGGAKGSKELGFNPLVTSTLFYAGVSVASLYGCKKFIQAYNQENHIYNLLQISGVLKTKNYDQQYSVDTLNAINSNLKKEVGPLWTRLMQTATVLGLVTLYGKDNGLDQVYFNWLNGRTLEAAARGTLRSAQTMAENKLSAFTTFATNPYVQRNGALGVGAVLGAGWLNQWRKTAQVQRVLGETNGTLSTTQEELQGTKKAKQQVEENLAQANHNLQARNTDLQNLNQRNQGLTESLKAQEAEKAQVVQALQEALQNQNTAVAAQTALVQQLAKEQQTVAALESQLQKLQERPAQAAQYEHKPIEIQVRTQEEAVIAENLENNQQLAEKPKGNE